MQSISFTNVTLIDETRESSGRPLWLSLTNRASKLNFATKIFHFVELEKDLKPLFVDEKCISYIDCLRTCKTFSDLSDTLTLQANELGSQKALLVIDNLTLLLRRFGVDQIAALLFEIGQICPVLSRLQRDSFSEIEQNRLKSIAMTVLSLSKNDENSAQVCTTITTKKGGGGIREKVESYEISHDTASITSRSMEMGGKKKSATTTPSSDFMPCHGGGSHERVQREKASITLPFTRAQKEKGLVGLNADRQKPKGAKIEYFADKSDDFDESDMEDF